MLCPRNWKLTDIVFTGKILLARMEICFKFHGMHKQESNYLIRNGVRLCKKVII